MSRKHVLKIREFSGATTDNMYHCLMPLLQKQPVNVILHVKENDASSWNSSEIVNNNVKTKIIYISKIPKCKHYFNETDYEVRHRNVIIEEVNIQLNDFDFNMIDNINLSRAHVNDRGLHLNTKGVCHSLQKIWLKVFRNDEINKG